ncbi:MAG: sugar-binding transcriptional regulator [Galactobacter sp.]
MPSTPTAQHRRQLARLARAHYMDGLSKVQIADAFGLSRFQVARMLQEAMDAGVVTISIEADTFADDDHGAQLAEALGLAAVTIVPAPAGEVAQAMGRAALARVESLARPGMRIGLSWSRTLDAAAAYAPALPRCTVVQLAGALRLQSASRPTMGIFERLGQDQAVHLIRLPAPLLVTETETATDLCALPEITDTLEAADNLDLALVSVGAWGEGLSSVWAKCEPTVRERAADQGAVAEVSGRLIGEDGVSVNTIDDRVIAVTADQLRAAGTTLGVAHGPDRAAAVRAAADAGLLDHIIIDEPLAAALLAELGSAPTEPASSADTDSTSMEES